MQVIVQNTISVCSMLMVGDLGACPLENLEKNDALRLSLRAFLGHSHACCISYKVHGQLNAIAIVWVEYGICMLPTRFLKKQLEHDRMRYVDHKSQIM